MEAKMFAAVGLVSASVALSACSSAGDEAKRRFEIAEAGGASSDELCRLAGEVAGTYKVDGADDQFEAWELRRKAACLLAASERELRRLSIP